jgi:hypothetical protein
MSSLYGNSRDELISICCNKISLLLNQILTCGSHPGHQCFIRHDLPTVDIIFNGRIVVQS